MRAIITLTFVLVLDIIIARWADKHDKKLHIDSPNVQGSCIISEKLHIGHIDLNLHAN